jgi:hypothetical protein
MNTLLRRKSGAARIEIDSVALARLIAGGQLKVCELRCLDNSSKQLVRQLCLESCSHCPLSGI